MNFVSLPKLSRTTWVVLLLVILIPSAIAAAVLVLQAAQTPPVAQRIDAAAFNKAIAEGDAALSRHAYDEALAAYDRAEQANAFSPVPATKRGNVYSAQGQYDRAIAQYQAAIAKDSTYADAYY